MIDTIIFEDKNSNKIRASNFELFKIGNSELITFDGGDYRFLL